MLSLQGVLVFGVWLMTKVSDVILFCLRVIVDEAIAALFAVGELCALEVFLYCYCQYFDTMTLRSVVGDRATIAFGTTRRVT